MSEKYFLAVVLRNTVRISGKQWRWHKISKACKQFGCKICEFDKLSFYVITKVNWNFCSAVELILHLFFYFIVFWAFSSGFIWIYIKIVMICNVFAVLAVTHTSLFCLHVYSRCWVHPLPSSSECTPCFRVKSRIWWAHRIIYWELFNIRQYINNTSVL